MPSQDIYCDECGTKVNNSKGNKRSCSMCGARIKMVKPQRDNYNQGE